LTRFFRFSFFSFRLIKLNQSVFKNYNPFFSRFDFFNYFFFNFLNLINFFIVLLIHRSDQFKSWGNGRVLLLFLELICCLIISREKNDTYYQDSRRLLTVMHAARRWNAPPVLFLPTFKFGQSVLIIIAGVQQGAIQVTTS
jgi:hypothetical protein